MKLQVLVAFLCGALIAFSVSTRVSGSSVAHAQTPNSNQMTMCNNGQPIPAGYVVTDEQPGPGICVDMSGKSWNVWTITKFSPNPAVQTRVDMCSDQTIPSGAVIEGWQTTNICTTAAAKNKLNIVILDLYQ